VNTVIPEKLLHLIRRKAGPPAVGALQALVDRIRATYGPAVRGILFYGSCLRSGDDRGGMVDLYVIVDSYANAYHSRHWALFNQMLPPNVFYLETRAEGRVVRAKYAVLSLADLQRGTSRAWFHSYLWGRFAQPAAVLYARSPDVAEQLYRALGQAVVTFLSRVIPCAPERFSTRELWLKGFSLSYRAELRAERPDKIAGLFHSSADFYQQVTAAALTLLPYRVEPIIGEGGRFESHIPARRRLCCRTAWRVRSLQGKVLSLLRLFKGAFTFSGGLDYILWKIERHTGVTVEVPPRLRRHPILAVCILSWRLYRNGAFR
jgi:hypothetical protein